MSLEIRPITSEEVEQAETVMAEAFNMADRRDMAAAVERARTFYQPDWYLAAFEDGEMTAAMRVLPFAMRLNGRPLPFGAVSPVATLPSHRRKGHTGAMLRRSLAIMRERGQALSGLYTPHPMLYRRYGWEIASEAKVYTFSPKDFRLQVEPSERGRLRNIAASDWPLLDRVYRAYGAQRNGPLHRGEVWWRNAVLGEAQPPPLDAVLWEDGRGEGLGYLVYAQPLPPSPEAGKVVARELVALNGDAYLNLLLFLAHHDLASEIVVRAPASDPLLNLVADAERVKVRQDYAVLLRICDVEKALAGRAPADSDRNAEFVLEVKDAAAPWNEGVWRTWTAEGRTYAERAQAQPDIEVSAAALAPIFNGYLAPSTAAACGLIAARSEEAVVRADHVFAAAHRPFFTDFF